MKKKTLKENARHGPKDSQQESKASYFKDCKDCSNCYQQSKQFDFCNKKKNPVDEVQCALVQYAVQRAGFHL
jgi:hypothetical protein